MEVSLVNKDDKVIAKADPTDNGFYLIPIDYKQDFRITVSSKKGSYNFSPEFHIVALNGLSDDSADQLLKS